MKSIVVLLLLVVPPLCVAQATFHGNVARTGVYESAGPSPVERSQVDFQDRRSHRFLEFLRVISFSCCAKSACTALPKAACFIPLLVRPAWVTAYVPAFLRVNRAGHSNAELAPTDRY
jgi:hypothetical protein